MMPICRRNLFTCLHELWLSSFPKPHQHTNHINTPTTSTHQPHHSSNPQWLMSGVCCRKFFEILISASLVLVSLQLPSIAPFYVELHADRFARGLPRQSPRCRHLVSRRGRSLRPSRKSGNDLDVSTTSMFLRLTFTLLHTVSLSPSSPSWLAETQNQSVSASTRRPCAITLRSSTKHSMGCSLRERLKP
jgi:hypothetical protein